MPRWKREDIGKMILATLTDGAPAKTVQTAAVPPPEISTAATGSDPALLRVGTMPISLLPKAGVTAQRAAADRNKRAVYRNRPALWRHGCITVRHGIESGQ